MQQLQFIYNFFFYFYTLHLYHFYSSLYLKIGFLKKDLDCHQDVLLDFKLHYYRIILKVLDFKHITFAFISKKPQFLTMYNIPLLHFYNTRCQRTWGCTWQHICFKCWHFCMQVKDNSFTCSGSLEDNKLKT